VKARLPDYKIWIEKSESAKEGCHLWAANDGGSEGSDAEGIQPGFRRDPDLDIAGDILLI